MFDGMFVPLRRLVSKSVPYIRGVTHSGLGAWTARNRKQLKEPRQGSNLLLLPSLPHRKVPTLHLTDMYNCRTWKVLIQRRTQNFNTLRGPLGLQLLP